MHIKYTCNILPLFDISFLTFLTSTSGSFEHRACFGLAAFHAWKHSMLERWHWPLSARGWVGYTGPLFLSCSKDQCMEHDFSNNQSSHTPIYLEEAGFGWAHCNSDTTWLWCFRAWVQCPGGRTHYGQTHHAPERCHGVGAASLAQQGRTPELWVTLGPFPLLPSAG